MTRSITTRNGDQGRTSLFSGEIVAKYCLRTEACGDVDELGSVLGVARAHSGNPVLESEIHDLQQALFTVAAEMATSRNYLELLSCRVDQASVTALEERMALLESSINMPGGFVVPGGSVVSAHLDHARTVARRCERKAVRLHDDGDIENNHLLIWLNRVSDYLWLLARREEGEHVIPKDR